MSLISWMFRRKPAPAPESSGLSRIDPTRPAARAQPENNARPANRKSERMAQRELLYGVVRECMVRAGVITSKYKFKVLSLDSRGRQFMIMVDLSHDCGVAPTQLSEIEAAIAQAAKSRHEIVVTAVYWRMNEHVAIGVPEPHKPVPAAVPAAPPQPKNKPVAFEAQPAPLSAPGGQRYEPIRSDEVNAFREALAAGLERPLSHQGAAAQSFDGTAVHGPQSYTLLTGFEDTEVADGEQRTPAALSGTQYGELM